MSGTSEPSEFRDSEKRTNIIKKSFRSTTENVKYVRFIAKKVHILIKFILSKVKLKFETQKFTCFFNLTKRKGSGNKSRNSYKQFYLVVGLGN